MAAVSSLLAFAVGAFVVVIPYLAASGTALITAVILAGAALGAVGSGTGALNGRNVARSGLRQVDSGGDRRRRSSSGPGTRLLTLGAAFLTGGRPSSCRYRRPAPGDPACPGSGGPPRRR